MEDPVASLSSPVQNAKTSTIPSLSPSLSPKGTPKSYDCSYCDKKYTKLSKLTQHIRKHTGERPYVCEYDGCGQAFTRPAHLRRHVASIHEHEKNFACSRCDKKFSDKTHLKRHESQHDIPKPFVCTFESCDASFSKHNQLKRHLCSHTGELPYECSYEGCDKRFSFPGQLKLHVERFHSLLDVKKYVCPVCMEAFVKNSELVTHQRESDHLPRMTYKCEECGLELKSKKNLTAHLLTHDIDRSLFTCRLCSKGFSTKSNLKAHVKSSHEAIKYECNVCHATFAHKHSLARHKRTHDPFADPSSAEALTPNIDSNEPFPSISSYPGSPLTIDTNVITSALSLKKSGDVTPLNRSGANTPKSPKSPKLNKSQTLLEQFLGAAPPRVSVVEEKEGTESPKH